MAQYLLDGAAMLYPVAGRELLADQALTSKERMVLGRWLDDGRIEAMPMVGDRVIEIADFTGMPVIARRNYRQYAERFPWVTESPGADAAAGPPSRQGRADSRRGRSTRPAAGPAERTVAKYAAPAQSKPAGRLAAERVFAPRARPAQTRVSTRAIEPAAAPSSLGAALLARSWRCPEEDCPSFGAAPRARPAGAAAAQGRAVVPAAREGAQRRSGRARPSTRSRWSSTTWCAAGSRSPPPRRSTLDARADDDDVSLELWLHEAAARWIAERHAELEIVDGGLVVTDVGENGTVVWHRTPPGRPGESRAAATRASGTRSARTTRVELYTGVELVPGNRRVVGGPVSAPDVRSVLVDAPTVALRARSAS